MSHKAWAVIGAMPVTWSRTGLLHRVVRLIQATRMRRARRNIGRHLQFVPQDILKKAGYTASQDNDGALPFTR